MTEHHDQLQEAGEAYQRAKAELDRHAAELAQHARDAYAGGMKKAAILRTINHAWSDTWLDRILAGVDPPPSNPRRTRRTT